MRAAAGAPFSLAHWQLRLRLGWRRGHPEPSFLGSEAPGKKS